MHSVPPFGAAWMLGVRRCRSTSNPISPLRRLLPASPNADRRTRCPRCCGAPSGADPQSGTPAHPEAHFAVHYLNNGGSIVRLQQLLGHSELGSTILYLRYASIPLREIDTPLDVLQGRHRERK